MKKQWLRRGPRSPRMWGKALMEATCPGSHLEVQFLSGRVKRHQRGFETAQGPTKDASTFARRGDIGRRGEGLSSLGAFSVGSWAARPALWGPLLSP